MTTDATKGNAEQWHIPPQGDLSSVQRDLAAYQKERQADARPQVNRMEPAISAVYAVDLQPLISHFASELQRERDRVAVERTTASSAREALAACEERLRNEKAFRDREVLEEANNIGLWREMHTKAVADLEALRARLVDMEEQRDHARCEAHDAQQMLMYERARKPVATIDRGHAWELSDEDLASALSCECTGQEPLGKLCGLIHEAANRLRVLRRVEAPSLTPGSTAAVIEAYRLLTGHEPQWTDRNKWHGRAWHTEDQVLSDACDELVRWLDKHAPGGRP